MGTLVRVGPLALALAAVAGGCKQNPVAPPPTGVGGLAVDSVTPSPGTLDAPYVGPVYVYFDKALDPTTVTEQTLGVVVGSVAIPGRVIYDDSRHAAVLDLALAPGVDYQGIATISVRSVDGEGLDSNYTWDFHAKNTARQVVDPANASGSGAVVAVDAGGVIHVAYLDSLAGAVKYAECGSGCDQTAGWTVVTVATDAGTDSRLDLAIAPDGGAALAYYIGGIGALGVSTCAQGCATPASWQTAVLDDAVGDAGYAPSIARATDGTLHVIYQQRGVEDLRYLTCTTGCGSAASWSPAITLDAGVGRGRASDLGVTSTGGLHAVWVSDQDGLLVYGFCPASCATFASWTVTALVSTAGAADRVALAVTPTDRPVVMFGLPSFLAIGICVSTNCNTDASWSLLGPLLSDIANDARPSVAVDANGRIHGVYATGGGAVRYLSCTVSCDVSPTQWVAGTFSGGTDIVDAALALDQSAVPVVMARTQAGGLVFVR